MPELTPEDNFFNKYPYSLPLHVSMDAPNEIIQVYNGSFILKNSIAEIDCEGNLEFVWLPSSGCTIKANAEVLTFEKVKLLQNTEPINLFIENKNVGEVFIVKANLMLPFHFKGILKYECVVGDIFGTIDTVRFCIPNLKSFHGDVVRYERDPSNTISSARISLESADYLLIIDKRRDYETYKLLLDSEGGYIITYAGQLTKKNGKLDHSNAVKVLACLNCFLTFINGFQVSALFLEGGLNDEIVWKDYTNYLSQPFQTPISWTDIYGLRDFDVLWKLFSHVWKSAQGEEFLRKSIHWYVEANYAPVFSESKIIMAQTGLELVFNWYFIENKKLIDKEAAKYIKAAEKIRIILRHLKINLYIPIGLGCLINEKQFKDGPDAFTQIRNAIVHGNLGKRKKLDKLTPQTLFQAQQLGIWYLELSILFILGYTGTHYNRTVRNGGIEVVPWKDNN